jgi:hypothetical protein
MPVRKGNTSLFSDAQAVLDRLEQAKPEGGYQSVLVDFTHHGNLHDIKHNTAVMALISQAFLSTPDVAGQTADIRRQRAGAESSGIRMSLPVAAGRNVDVAALRESLDGMRQGLLERLQAPADIRLHAGERHVKHTLLSFETNAQRNAAQMLIDTLALPLDFNGDCEVVAKSVPTLRISRQFADVMRSQCGTQKGWSVA